MHAHTENKILENYQRSRLTPIVRGSLGGDCSSPRTARAINLYNLYAVEF